MSVNYLELAYGIKPGNSTISVEAYIREANVMPEPKQTDCVGISGMSRSILIMAGGTGGYILGFDITRAAHALVSAEKVANIEGFYV